MKSKTKVPADSRAPAATDDHDGVNDKAREEKAHLKTVDAALREQPEDRRDAARRTTPPGKARSQ